jgi:hypothetical protein
VAGGHGKRKPTDRGRIFAELLNISVKWNERSAGMLGDGVGPLRTLVDFPQFQSGLASGVVAALCVLVVGLLVKRDGRVGPGLVGCAFVVASYGVVDGWFGGDRILVLPDALLIGLVFLFIGGELAVRTRAGLVAGLVFAVPGALCVAVARDLPGPAWVPWLVGIGTVVGAASGADVDRRTGRLGLGPVLFLISVGGVYATVPDTEVVRALVGAAIPLAIVGWPLRAARLGAGGTAAAIGWLLWVAAFEGYGRPGSIIGAFGALALLATEAWGRQYGRSRIIGLAQTVSLPALTASVVGAQIVLALYASRIAGLVDDGLVALVLVIPGLVGGVAFGAIAGLTSQLRPRRSTLWRRRVGRLVR